MSLVHRDIKPLNIILDNKGKFWLLDFGIAKHLDLVSITPTNNPFGPFTLGYASSEQFRNFKKDKPGSVCPFAVVNDTKHNVKIVLDKTMIEADLVCYHPLDNTMTISLSPSDLLLFFDHTGHKPTIMQLND